MPGKQAGAPRMSDAAVRAKTGKIWAEWLKTLDAAGARNLAHPEIAKFLHVTHKLSGWWSQMVTVTYEQARGLRQKHERPEGFSISASRTLGVPVERAFAAWHDAKLRRRWLDDADLTIRKATPAKSMRITWMDGKTSVEVNFYPKGDGRCQVVAQHMKLADARQADKMKKYWGEQLDKLKMALARTQ